MNRRTLFAAVALAASAASFPAAAAEVTGLVLEVTGSTTPQVSPFNELTAGEVIKLSPDAKLKVVHYTSCRVLALSGGAVQAGPADFTVTGGTVDSNILGRCPQQKTLVPASGNGVGGITMRSMVDPPVGVVPGETFVLAGDGARGVERIRIIENQRIIAEWTPKGALSWHVPANVLKIGASAVLEIRRKDKPAPLTQSLFVMNSVTDDVASKLMVIEVN